jgi:hypothetical protein
MITLLEAIQAAKADPQTKLMAAFVYQSRRHGFYYYVHVPALSNGDLLKTKVLHVA